MIGIACLGDPIRMQHPPRMAEIPEKDFDLFAPPRKTDEFTEKGLSPKGVPILHERSCPPLTASLKKQTVIFKD